MNSNDHAIKEHKCHPIEKQIMNIVSRISWVFWIRSFGKGKVLHATLMVLFLFPSTQIIAQTKDVNEHIAAVVYLDSFIVTAKRKGFDVDDFIHMVRSDKSFYRAFRNLRFLTYDSDNSIEMFDKKAKLKASYFSILHQQSDGRCRSMTPKKEVIRGKFYKKEKEYRYFTAKLIDRLFFTHGTVCESRKGGVPKGNPKGLEKQIHELKKLMFQPGEKADVLFIGDKTAIFDEKMMRYYDFSITSKLYQDSIDCYVFTAKVKPQYEHKKADKTVIKYLETYFEKSNFQVIAREYRLKNNTILFDFDVTMKIKLTRFGKQYVPEFIEYDGGWDLAFKKPEISKSSVRFYGFQ